MGSFKVCGRNIMWRLVLGQEKVRILSTCVIYVLMCVNFFKTIVL